MVGFSLTTSEAGTPGSPWRFSHNEAHIRDSSNTGDVSSEQFLSTEPLVLRRQEEVVSKSTVLLNRIHQLVHDNTAQPSSLSLRTTTEVSPARTLLHSRALMSRPAGKNPRGDGDQGRGSGISRGTSSPSKGRVTRRADAGSSGSRSSSSSRSGSSSSGSSGSKRQSSSIGSRSTRRSSSSSRDTSTISTYQWLLNDQWQP